MPKTQSSSVVLTTDEDEAFATAPPLMPRGFGAPKTLETTLLCNTPSPTSIKLNTLFGICPFSKLIVIQKYFIEFKFSSRKHVLSGIPYFNFFVVFYLGR